ncbi:DNA primase [Tissierellaceae bacterium HCP3S3_D8]
MASYISDETIEKVKDRCDILEIVSDYVPLKKSGANYLGLCPFHNEKTPSFTVSDTRQFYHCFGCGEGGDSISFIMKKENMDFVEAVKFLANKYGIEIKEGQVKDRYTDEKERLYKINREAARFFYKNLISNSRALEYLRRRQIGPKVIQRFGLGYSPNSWDSIYKYLNNIGYKDEEIEKIGLIAKRNGNNGYYDRFRNRIIFPIIDTNSRVIGFGGRVMDQTMPKYLNSKESIIFNKGEHLYGLNLVSKHSNRQRILLVEGYMDVISLHSKGINYAVASLGTSLTQRQSKLLKRYGKEVYICYDSDAAGIKATLRAINILLEDNIHPRIIILPDGMDPDEYINKYGMLEFEKLYANSYNYVDYRIYILKDKYNIDNTEDKIKFTIEVAAIIRSLNSPVKQDVYIEKVSEETGISKEAIKKEIMLNMDNTGSGKDSKTFKNKAPDIEPVRYKITSGYLKAELDLIRLMIDDRDYFNLISDKLSIDDFSSVECKKIYRLIDEEYNASNLLRIDNIVEFAKDSDIDIDLINFIAKNEVKYETTIMEDIIRDLINTVIHNNLEKQRQEVLNSIEVLEKKQEKDEEENRYFIDLCLELTRLNNEIKLIRHE